VYSNGDFGGQFLKRATKSVWIGGTPALVRRVLLSRSPERGELRIFLPGRSQETRHSLEDGAKPLAPGSPFYV